MGNCGNKKANLTDKKFTENYNIKTGHPEGGEICKKSF